MLTCIDMPEAIALKGKDSRSLHVRLDCDWTHQSDGTTTQVRVSPKLLKRGRCLPAEANSGRANLHAEEVQCTGYSALLVSSNICNVHMVNVHKTNPNHFSFH